MIDINWKPNAKELRKFGVAMIVGFSIIGAIFRFGIWPLSEAVPNVATGCWIFGAVSGILGLTGTKFALPIYLAWMGVAFVIGNIISHVLLTLVFYTLFAGMRYLAQVIGRDKLCLKKPDADSYWVDLPPLSDDHNFERQF